MEDYLRFRIKRSLNSSNDFIYRNNNSKCLKQFVDLRPFDTIIENQQSLNSCTSSAITSTYELMVKQLYPDQYVELSDLFVYYNARDKEGSLNDDNGIYIRTALEVLKQYGVCEENIWPYDLEKWDDKPSEIAYQDALKRRIPKYQKIISTYYLTEVLCDSKPAVFGMEIYDSFMELDNRISTVTFPSRKEKSLGGHAMCMVGYDLEKRLFLAKNSFGTDWGMEGYCWIPFDYLKQEAYDCWIFDIPPQSGEQNVLPQTLLPL